MHTKHRFTPVLCAGILSLAATAPAASRTLPTPNPSGFADAESSRNVPLSGWNDETRNFVISLAATTSPTSAVQVAFGTDANRGNAAPSRSGARTANWFETEYDNIIRNMMQPKVVVTPEVVPLSQAVGTRVSFWCNMTNIIARSYRATLQNTRLMFTGASDAELMAADDEDMMEILLENYKGISHGFFYIEDDRSNSSNDNPGTSLTEREDATIFSGEWYHVVHTNEHRYICVTARTIPESTSLAVSTLVTTVPTNLAAFVGFYMATAESGLDSYDDGAYWAVAANGSVIAEGNTTVSAHAFDMVRGPIYGVSDGAVFLGGTVLPPSGGAPYQIRPQASVWNVGDGKKETCLQIVICTIDEDGNVFCKPSWTPEP